MSTSREWCYDKFEPRAPSQTAGAVRVVVAMVVETTETAQRRCRAVRQPPCHHGTTTLLIGASACACVDENDCCHACERWLDPPPS